MYKSDINIDDNNNKICNGLPIYKTKIFSIKVSLMQKTSQQSNHHHLSNIPAYNTLTMFQLRYSSRLGKKLQRPSLLCAKRSGSVNNGPKNRWSHSQQRKQQTVPELQNHKLNRPPKQTYAESNADLHQYHSGGTANRRTGRLQTR